MPSAVGGLLGTLGYGDAHGIFPAGVLAFLALFVPVWWAWIGISYFVDQFALPETAARLLLFQQIALSLGLAVGLPGVIAGDVGLFGWWCSGRKGARSRDGLCSAGWRWRSATPSSGCSARPCRR